MQSYVNIVISDRGWILERLAREICERLNYVRYDDAADSRAFANYYMTYGSWKEKITPIEIGYFTHLEKDEKTYMKFFKTANMMDYCICHSKHYENVLREHGITNVTSINPGVDLKKFTPRLQIGVVGRTYHTGRKGEAMLAKLMDIDWIDWHFTGNGWPGPALNLSDQEMPGFYRKMDYILVPALYEGGPMCVAEALACGTKVIAPPIGWVPQFEHIEYRTGDEVDLRRVLEELYAKKKQLAAQVSHMTWDNWAEGHDIIFQKIAKKHDKILGNFKNTKEFKNNIALIIHGKENIHKGGAFTRAPITANLLKHSESYNTKFMHSSEFDKSLHQMVHIYNLYPLESCRNCIEAAYRSNKLIILSSIYLDHTEHPYYMKLRDIFTEANNEEILLHNLNLLYKDRMNEIQNGDKFKETFVGDINRISELISLTDHVILLSNHEKQMFDHMGVELKDYSIVKNPVNVDKYSGISSKLFESKYNVKDYILCVGRVEARKNQLMLIYALKDTDIPIVLVGERLDSETLKLIKKYGFNVIMTGRLESGSQLLASAYAGARVFCLPSWMEGASLAALEAAASGCNMVLSNRSSEQEYFGSYATYCDPFSLDSIRDSVIKEFDNPKNENDKYELKNYIKNNYSWEKHIEATNNIYKKVLSKNKKIFHVSSTKTIYIDITSILNDKNISDYMSLAGFHYAMSLINESSEIILIIWNKSYRTFISISKEDMINGRYKQLASNNPGIPLQEGPSTPYRNINFKKNSTYLVLGNVMIENDLYFQDLQSTIIGKNLSLACIIDDLSNLILNSFNVKNDETILNNYKKLISRSDIIFYNSEKLLAELRNFVKSKGLINPVYKKIKFPICKRCIYDEHRELPFNYSDQFDNFVLYVADINIAANHILLYNIWQNFLNKYDMSDIPNLVLVAHEIDKNCDFNKLLKNNIQLKEKIHVLYDVDKKNLNNLYDRCLFTVFPRFSAGRELPLYESICHGKICLASDQVYFSEKNIKGIKFLNPYDYKLWLDVIYQLASNGLYRKSLEEHINYQDNNNFDLCSIEMQQAIKNLSMLNNLPWLCVYNKIYKFNSDEVDNMLAGGWDKPEKNGRWTNGNQASIVCRIALPKNECFIRIKCSNPNLKDEEYQELKMLINGSCKKTFFINNNQSYYYIPFDYETISYQSNEFIDLRIDINIKNHLQISDHNINGSETQKLGVLVEEFELWQTNEKNQNMFNFLEKISKIDKACGYLLRYLLIKRPDIVNICNTHKYPFEFLLMWAWIYGYKEQFNLREIRSRLKPVFQHLHSISYNGIFSKYTHLINLVWRSRPDLHSYSPITSDGQQAIYEWYITSGRNECELSEFD